MSPPNRAILLTPPGGAALAVVRLAGPGLGDFLRSHFSRTPAAGRCTHGRLADGAGEIDDPVVVLGPGGAWADLSLHGGPWVVRRTLDLAARAGFDVLEGPAAPEAAAALDADDPLEAEVLSHLPRARTELALRVLLRQREAWAALGERLADPAAPGTRQRLARILDDGSLHALLNPPRVAIVGAANVGKSTLANRLFARERAITADLPGTTRDWVGEVANLDGLAVLLVDTPGLRRTDDALEAAAIERGGAEIARADLVVLVLDSARPLEPDQAPLLARFPNALRVLNKCDRPPAWDDSDEAPGPGALRLAATTGQNVDALRSAVRRHFGAAEEDPGRPRWWTRRQRDVLEKAAGPSAR